MAGETDIDFDFATLDAVVSGNDQINPTAKTPANADLADPDVPPPGKFAGPEHLAELAGKFVAVDFGESPDQPFVLIPAHIYARLPAWVWPAAGMSLLILVAAMMYLPDFRLGRLASKLGDGDLRVVQDAMRELIVSGDERAVGQLYDMAASGQAAMPARMRAIDTLGLIPHRSADAVLLRLELSELSEPPIRAAAVAARRQRERQASRPRYR
ncbi:MAG: hypothetical protein LBU23_07960 [Planctomycetota bacterium]|jgi:hypothetical protein|nr:hypothetical protein [Planctomycetota bacterium]